MPTPNGHADLSPSASHRWLECPPSARLEQKFKDQPSEASLQGTAAHALGEHKILRALKRRSVRPVSTYDDDEMENYTDAYRDYVLEVYEQEKLSNPETSIYLEVPLDLQEYIPEGRGTSDAVIISDRCMHVIDLKYGTGVLVEAKNNPQLMIYSLGVYERFSPLYDFDTVAMTIFQPRIDNVDSWEISVEELLTWANDILIPAAKTAFAGAGEFHCGKWCQFCKAANRCRKRAEEQIKLAQADFRKPPLLSDHEVEEFLPKLNDLIKWANDLQEYALSAAVNNGKQWKGYKLVHGRSIRKYTDEGKVAEAARNAGYTDIYKKSLIGITEMEKLMGKATFKEVLGSLVIKPEGKLTLVPESDKRSAVSVTTAKDDFKPIEKEGNENE